MRHAVLGVLVCGLVMLGCESRVSGPGQANDDDQRYTWSLGDYGACVSASGCGTGVRAREMICQNALGTAVADTFCGDRPQPDLVDCIDTALCQWRTTATSACNAPTDCSSGSYTQVSDCRDGDGNEVDASWCTAPRPPEQGTCARTSACVVELSDSACSASATGCGQGTITRTRTCKDPSGGVVPISFCGTEPTQSIPCLDYSLCYADVVGPWGACGTTCGVATRSRTVVCRAPDGAQVNASWCTVATSEACSETTSCCDAAATAASPFAGGSGTTSDPYIVCSAAQLDNVRTGKNLAYLLGADLDLATVPFVPLTTGDEKFSGIFDGDGHTIDRLTIDTPASDDVGMFGRLQVLSDVRDLHLTNVDVTGNTFVGGLAGRAEAGAHVQDVTVTGSMLGNDYVGGLAGTVDGVAERVATNVVVVANDYAGAITGAMGSLGTLARASALGEVSGRDYVGGAVGHTRGHLWRVSADAVAEGRNFVGGAVGGAEDYAIVECEARGSATGTSYVGGLVGSVRGIVVESRSTASASGTTYVGGLVGFLDGFAGHVFSTGASSGGGLVGAVTPDAEVKGSFWDTQSSGQSSSADGTAVGKTSTQMRTPATYAGWQTYTMWQLTDGELPVFRDSDAPCPKGPAAFSGGAGTPLDPYLIDRPDQVYAMACNPGAKYAIAADLDFTSTTSTPAVDRGAMFEALGVRSAYVSRYVPFTGTLDGRGHRIIGWTGYDLFGGFFASLSTNVTNVTFDNVDVAGGLRAGGVVALLGGSMSRVSASGRVRAGMVAGGVVGAAQNPNASQGITRSFADVDVITHAGVAVSGGFVGSLSVNARVRDSYSTGSVAGSVPGTGGFAGSGDAGSTIERCYSTGVVTGYYVSGFSGQNTTVTNSYWDTEASGVAISFGGAGRTTAQMQTQSTFQTWDFDTVWTIAPGSYPTLR